MSERVDPLPKVILVDDHRMVVEGLARAIEGRAQVIGTAANGDELLALLRWCPADCLLLDVALPGRNGIQLLPDILRIQPELSVIMLTMMDDRALAVAALAAGARGYVPKSAPVGELLDAIATVMEGDTYVSPRLSRATHCVGLDARHAALRCLTPRQEQVMMLIGEGHSCMEIARRLHLRASTVTFHKHNIMRILAIRADHELLRYAVLLREGASARRAVRAAR
jgi:DNA-binding NarL/FixJ family response regulator